jgi:hypothetical protein
MSGRTLIAQTPVMVKRTASALLWLVAVGWAFNFISAYTGAPQVLGTALAAGVAVFVWVDPLHVLWAAPGRSPSTPKREIAPVAEPAHGQI